VVHGRGIAAGLLRRHVGRRPHDAAVVADGRLAGVSPGQAEVRQVRPVLAVEQDVGRLDVAVDDAVLVRVVQGVGHLREHYGSLAGGETAGGKDVSERRALDEPGHQVRQAVLLPDLVDRDDRLVVQPDAALGLVEDPLAVVPGEGSPLVGDLDGDVAVELPVVRLVDDAERPAAHLLDQLEPVQRPRPRAVHGEGRPFRVQSDGRPAVRAQVGPGLGPADQLQAVTAMGAESAHGLCSAVG
jgi:hypothetical protein